MKVDADFEPVQAAKKLLRESRSGALATLFAGSGDPYCSLVNVATDHSGAPLMLLSQLALHTKNLGADARVSLMLDERKSGDPLEGARIMLMGKAGVTEEPVARARYLARHAGAQAYAGFGDFGFYRIEIERAHLVAGFGRIVDLAASEILTDLSGADALLAAEDDAVAHMNQDHADSLRLYATKLLGAPEGAWRCVGCDPDGLDLQLNDKGLRLSFRRRVTGPGALREMLVQMAREARAR